MQRTYVLRLTSDANPSQGYLSGWIEDVETGRELRFRTADGLLTFLAGPNELVPGEEGGDTAASAGADQTATTEGSAFVTKKEKQP